jgi:hypothetical protein
MRAKGYLGVEDADRILVQQVCRKFQNNKAKNTPRPESVAALSLLALATVATTARLALQITTSDPMAAPIVVAGGINASILPSMEREVRKTSHQKQIDRQNKAKRKAVHTQAHARATTLVTKERPMPKEVCRMTVQVIEQVDGGVQGTLIWCQSEQAHGEGEGEEELGGVSHEARGCTPHR